MLAHKTHSKLKKVFPTNSKYSTVVCPQIHGTSKIRETSSCLSYRYLALLASTYSLLPVVYVFACYVLNRTTRLVCRIVNDVYVRVNTLHTVYASFLLCFISGFVFVLLSLCPYVSGFTRVVVFSCVPRIYVGIVLALPTHLRLVCLSFSASHHRVCDHIIIYIFL